MFEIPYGPIAAATVLATLPLVLLVLLFQRRIVQGLTAGAVKGKKGFTPLIDFGFAQSTRGTERRKIDNNGS